jgi:hypothetical protein
MAMLEGEARWFGEKLAALDPAVVYPMLNVGSSTEVFRTVGQPWIDQFIFKPARVAGCQVFHVDMKEAPGVDLVGDLTDRVFLRRLERQTNCKSVFCSNLLEHVPDQGTVARALTMLLPPGGYLFVSCPYRYPYHPDPIDTRFRPTIDELAGLFPDTRLVEGEVVVGETYLAQLARSPRILAKTLIRLLLPFYKPRAWLNTWRHLRWLFRPFQATCVVLAKASDAAPGEVRRPGSG